MILLTFLFSDVLIYMHHDKAVNLIVTAFETFVSAWAAFRAKRKTREDLEHGERISAANKALFAIATMFNVFENLHRSSSTRNDSGKVRLRVSYGLAAT